MKNIKLSIIIINYNTYKLTIDCIKSIKCETKNTEYEVILIDNDSEEHEVISFEEYLSDIKVIRSKTNIGFSKAVNLGLSYAVGDYILLLNSDVIITGDAISRTLEVLRSNPEIGVITCKLVYPDNIIQNNCQSFPSVWKTLIEKTRFQKLLPSFHRSIILQGYYWNHDKDGFPDWVWGTFFMFPKKIIDELPTKKLNDEFFMYIEDMYWCWEIGRLGYKIYYFSDAAVIHLVGMSGGNGKHQLNENVKIFLREHYSKLENFLFKFLK